MGGTKQKVIRKKRSAANSPETYGPIGAEAEEKCSPACGHSHCGRVCNVRFCGPTTQLRDHHIVHAAKGVSHVWTAAIVSGLAVVLTGAIAYSVMASTQPDTVDTTQLELNAVRQKLNNIEKTLNRISQQPNTACQQ